MSLTDFELARNEIDVLKLCKHQNIIRFIDSFENYNYIYIVVEYLSGGDLKDFLDSNSNVSEDKAIRIITQVSSGLEYLHRFGILHRDLKPENLMMNSKTFDVMTIKLMDFGLSKVIGKHEKATEGYGTICYAAPEILLQKPYDTKSELWSLGIILYYTLSNSLPFDDENGDENNIARLTISRNINYSSKLWSVRSNDAVDLIKSCLNKNQDLRINLTQFNQSNWLCK